jgi:hypothetical protein
MTLGKQIKIDKRQEDGVSIVKFTEAFHTHQSAFGQRGALHIPLYKGCLISLTSYLVRMINLSMLISLIDITSKELL